MRCNKCIRLVKKVNFFGKLRNKKKNEGKSISIVSCLSNTTKIAAPCVVDIFQENHYNNNITPNIMCAMLSKTFFLTAETEILFFVLDIILIYIDLCNRINNKSTKKINKTLKE